MARVFPDGWATGLTAEQTGTDRRQEVLRGAGYIEVGEHPLDEPRTWTFEEIVGFLQSTWVCSRHVLGEGFDEFEADLRAALLQISPALRFSETIRWSYTLARKPG